jgi:hypothetical protein
LETLFVAFDPHLVTDPSMIAAFAVTGFCLVASARRWQGPDRR